MKFYMAPMEAVTGYVFRNAYRDFFGQVDTYITPFITGSRMGSKEKNDVCPEHNEGIHVIPQILTNRSDEFISLASQMQNVYGYEEVNLNLGCPSGTVVTKKRGAGMLSDLTMMKHFLDEIFDQCPTRISIKTRIGIDDTSEWQQIFELYEQYPLSELIVHPRLQKEFYTGTPHLEVYEEIRKLSRHRLCYNGDIRTVSDYHRILELFPDTERVMIGRGLLSNPSLIQEIKGGQPVDTDTFFAFHDRIFAGYKEIMSGDRNTLYKMKELWGFFGKLFEEPEKHLKKIRKSEKCLDYEIAVANLRRDVAFRNQTD